MASKICTACGTIGRAKKVTRGSVLIEIILWLCILLPGLLYSIWRMGSSTKVCRACGAPNMVPLNSPMGRQLRDRFQPR